MIRLCATLQANWKAPEHLRLSQWAEKYFYLSSESSTQPGAWQNIPYQIAPMDAMSDDEIRTVTIWKSARWGFTKMGVAFCGYTASHTKRSGLFVQPTEDDVKGFVKDEVDPAIRDCRAVGEVFTGADKTNSPDNTNHRKVFIGGIHDFIGAHSPRGFRRKTKHWVFYDETDGFELQAGEEGDQFSLGDKRMLSAPYPKSIRGSTPTTKGISKIEKSFAAADMQFEYYVPCPQCGYMQAIRFANLEYEKGKPLDAKLRCSCCDTLIPYSEQREMVANGRWQTDDGIYIRDDFKFFDAENNPVSKPEHIGFKSWCAISPFANASWGRICKEHLEVKDDPLKLKAFVNTVLGELWEVDEGEKLEADFLRERVEDYQSLSEIPNGVLAVTAGVDVQADRFEITLMGYGLSMERWVLGHFVEYCDTSVLGNYHKVLDSILDLTILAEDGKELIVLATAIDTGYATQTVYAYCKSQFTNLERKRLAIKGQSGNRPIFDPKPRKNWARGLNGWLAGVDSAKERIYAHLQIEEAGAGYIHFPSGLPDDYFEQLTTERKVIRFRKGKRYFEWIKANGARNEAFDTFVYADVAFESLSLDMQYLAKTRHESEKLDMNYFEEIGRELDNH